MKMTTTIVRMSTLIFALLTFSYSLQAQNKIEWRDLTFDQAMQAAAKEHRVIFVDVLNNNPNAYSRKVEETVFTKKSVADYFQKHFVAIRVNMVTDEGKKFAPRLAMLMYPVYVFFDKDGNQLSFINSGEILKKEGTFMEKSEGAVAIAHEKEVNTRSIAFDKSSWKGLLAKAKKENKLIFVDAYTTWCRPCIMMAKDIFTLDNVADFYNKNFINVSMDMEKGEGPGLAKKYEIKAYPTFLYVDGDGNLVHRDGGYQEASSFIQVGKDAVQARKEMK